MASSMQTYSLRMKPGEEIVETLHKFVKSHNLRAACIVTAVGSLTQAKLRLADSKTIKDLYGHFEIVSLVGTLNPENEGHLHLCLSKEDGTCIGGHVLGDLVVYTTAEIVIGENTSLVYTREFDPDTEYNELVINQRS